MLTESTSESFRDLFQGLNVQPRAYQQRICERVMSMFNGTHLDRNQQIETAARSVMIESPTGSGKTVMGLTIARALQQQYGARVGWVSMRRNLLAQAAEENHRRGFHVEMALLSMFDKAPPPCDLLIVDEAQHDAAASMASLHGMARPRWVLGLTATPFRTDRVKLCFDKVITDAGIGQLIHDGYLSPYHHFTIPAFTPERVSSVYLRDRQRWGQSVIFFFREDECNATAELLRDRGVRAEVVTGRSNRERQIDDFERGQLDVLLSMAVLTEGFDCPALQTVFCRPSGRGCTIQMAGRVFRRFEGMPFKQIVQCESTAHPMHRTAMPVAQFLWNAEGWRALTLNPEIDAISQHTLAQVAAAHVEIPNFLVQKRGVVRAARRRVVPQTVP